MDIPQEFEQTENATIEVPDEFASGPPNRMRGGAIRFAKWLFAPPYLLPELIWFLVALIVTDIALDLIPQPAAYWINPSASHYISTLGTPFRWGIWNLVPLGGYILMIGLVLHLISGKPAFVIWIALFLYHLGITAEQFRCASPFYLPFETPSNCSTVHTFAILLAGFLAGVVVWIAAKLGFLPGILSESLTSTLDTRTLKTIKRVSFSWIGLCIAAVLATVAFSPKPTWKLIQAAHVPLARTEAGLAYDTERSVAVLFGGTSSWSPTGGWKAINDTWEWNGEDWKQLHAQHNPSSRYAASMAFDEKRGVTVLFGGMQPAASVQNIFYDDTWEWDGTDWHEVFPSTRPPARQDAVMFFNPARGTIVIYGGYYVDSNSGTTIFLDDAWEWDGNNWQQLTFSELRRSSSSAAVFDPIRQQPLLMDVEGLWSWQDAHWVPLSFSNNPPGRWNSQLVFNPASRQIVMFGGYKDKDQFDDTWIYDGQGWEPLVTVTRPPRRNGHNMFYDQRRGTVVLFGGLNEGTFYDDTWELVQP